MASQQWAVIKDVPERWEADWYESEEKALEAAKKFAEEQNGIAYVVQEVYMVSVETKTVVEKTRRG